MAAAFFALCEYETKDAAIYALKCTRKLDVAKETLKDFEGLARYQPPLIADRIFQQESVFSVTAPPFRDMRLSSANGSQLARLIVPASCREVMLRKIVSFGTDRSFLFPDLDGAAAHINLIADNPVLVGAATPDYHGELERLRVSLQKELGKTLLYIDQEIAEFAALLDALHPD